MFHLQTYVTEPIKPYWQRTNHIPIYQATTIRPTVPIVSRSLQSMTTEAKQTNKLISFLTG